MTHSITHFFSLCPSPPHINASSSCHPASNKRQPMHGTYILKALGAQPSLQSEAWAPLGPSILNTGRTGSQADGQQQGLGDPPGVACTHGCCQTRIHRCVCFSWHIYRMYFLVFLSQNTHCTLTTRKASSFLSVLFLPLSCFVSSIFINLTSNVNSSHKTV